MLEKRISSEKIKSVSAKFSGFYTNLGNEFKSKEFKINQDRISFFQDPKDKPEFLTGINICFSDSKDLESTLDYIYDINCFFSLLQNIPSEISEILVIDEKNQKYEVQKNWLPVETLNKINSCYTKKVGLTNLNQYLEKWFLFIEKSKIACEQYFALQTLNKRYYSQLTLSLSLFAFEGFLNRYIEIKADSQIDNKCDRYISGNKHNNFCKNILFPKIEELVNHSFPELDNKDRYISTIEGLLSHAYETSFEDRLNDFFIRNDFLLNEDLEKINETQETFIKKILKFRNTYAHNSDDKISDIKSIENTFDYYKVVNKSIRILLLKDYLEIDDIEFFKNREL